MGCFLILLGGVFPRLALLIVWLARPVLVDHAFGGAFIIPLLGIIFLPFTTLAYAWVINSKFSDLEAGSNNPLKQTVEIAHSGIERIEL